MDENLKRVLDYAQLSPEDVGELLKEIRCPICGACYPDEFLVQECLEVLHLGSDGDTILAEDDQGKAYLISPQGVRLQKEWRQPWERYGKEQT